MGFHRTTEQGSPVIGQAPSESAATAYFVVMVCYPAQRCREAIVNPELTRRDIIHRIQTGEYTDIHFIHDVKLNGTWEDVTQDMIVEAAILAEPDPVASIVRLADHFDAVRNLHAEEA